MSPHSPLLFARLLVYNRLTLSVPHLVGVDRHSFPQLSFFFNYLFSSLCDGVLPYFSRFWNFLVFSPGGWWCRWSWTSRITWLCWLLSVDRWFTSSWRLFLLRELCHRDIWTQERQNRFLDFVALRAESPGCSTFADIFASPSSNAPFGQKHIFIGNQPRSLASLP